MTTYRLLTIGPSHYCEKARWALERAGVAFTEEVHLPLLHWPYVLAAVGSRTVPALVGPGVRLGESRDIVRFADERSPAGARLHPEGDDGREVARLEASFDAKLGPLVRRLAYCLLVPEPELFVRVFEPTAPPLERALLRRGHGALRAALGRAFKVSPRAEARCQEQLFALYADVARDLGERPYLVGERFSAADLTFAALSSPLLFPEELTAAAGSRVGAPSRDELPARLGDAIDALRETPAGRHALRMYREHRLASPPA